MTTQDRGELSLFDAIAMAIGGMVGGGIFKPATLKAIALVALALAVLRGLFVGWKRLSDHG